MRMAGAVGETFVAPPGSPNIGCGAAQPDSSDRL